MDDITTARCCVHQTRGCRVRGASLCQSIYEDRGASTIRLGQWFLKSGEMATLSKPAKLQIQFEWECLAELTCWCYFRKRGNFKEVTLTGGYGSLGPTILKL